MICFAVLAHEHEGVLAQQVRNISENNPGSKIVLYNSSGNPSFGRNIENLLICPYSRGPLAWGRTGRVLMDISAWLKETGMEYDYLVYIDSDVLFVKQGYERFLDSAMQGYDCMGVNMHQEYAPGAWVPGQSMWREWHAWQSLFGTDYLCGMFANGQVYRRELFHRMYDGLDKARLENYFSSTQVVGLEEILHATLAVRCGGRFRDYPVPAAAFVRYEPIMTVDEAKIAQRMDHIYFAHPIRRSIDDPARRWIAEGVEVDAPIPNRIERAGRMSRFSRASRIGQLSQTGKRSRTTRLNPMIRMKPMIPMNPMKRVSSGRRPAMRIPQKIVPKIIPRTTRNTSIRPSKARLMLKVVRSAVNRSRRRT